VRKTLLFMVASIALLIACDPARKNRIDEIRRTTGGDPRTGQQTIHKYGCQACHTIPGVQDAKAVVGPPLDHWSKRVYIAGEIPNTPENLKKWIQHPTKIEPKTAMPEMGVNDQDSADIAAYLYSLE
jgi:cytochrome c